MAKGKIIVQIVINSKIEKVWDFWTNPEYIKAWNSASEDWHTPYAENDLRKGGKFLSRMEARDGSFGFDFYGIYDEVKLHEIIAYTLGDGRTVRVEFNSSGDTTEIIQTFDVEDIHSIEEQRTGWQQILSNFKKYVENK